MRTGVMRLADACDLVNNKVFCLYLAVAILYPCTVLNSYNTLALALLKKAPDASKAGFNMTTDQEIGVSLPNTKRIFKF